MDFTTFQNQSENMEDLTNNASSNGANVTGNHPSVLTYIEITQLTVICFGIPCNIVIIFITSKCLPHRFSRYNVLYLFLAISDFVYLMGGLFGHIGVEGNLLNCCVFTAIRVSSLTFNPLIWQRSNQIEEINPLIWQRSNQTEKINPLIWQRSNQTEKINPLIWQRSNQTEKINQLVYI